MEKPETENPASQPEILDKPKSLSEDQQQPSAVSIAKPVEIMFDTAGGVIFHTHKELQDAAAWLIQRAKVPDALSKEGPSAVMAAILWCKELGLPTAVLNECSWVKGKLTQFGSLVAALAERHHEYGEKAVFFLDESQEPILMANKNLHKPVWAVVVRIKKKHGTIWNEYYFTVEEARQAGIYSGNWIKYQKDMLFHKAQARALRTEYASALKGINYDEDVREALETTYKPSPQVGAFEHKLVSASDLNKELDQ
jgi:hypothetical protein